MIRLALLGLLIQGPRDEATLVVRVDTLNVARETYSLGATRLSAGGSGWVLSATTRYDRDRPIIVYSPTLEIASDSMPVTLQFDVADPRDPHRVLGQLGRNRFTVRTVSKNVERAREFPLRAPAVVLDDDVFALYQMIGWFARPEPVMLTAIVARAGRREELTLTDSGMVPIVMQRRTVTLRYLTLAGGGNQLVQVWFDAEGRLARVAIPSRKLVAEREPTD